MFENRKETNKKTDRKISKADVYLTGFFLLLALGSLGVFAVNRKPGQTVQIFCDGQMLTSISLSQLRMQKMTGETNGEVRYCLILCQEKGVFCEWSDSMPNLLSTVPAGSSYNLLAVSETGVSMEASDCPDQICVHHRPISTGGESIICLPHKLVVEIRGVTGEDGLDGMVK